MQTMEYVHEREDHGHLLKHLTNCFRQGLFRNINMKAFLEALQDPKTGLTQQALTGERKQNVHDCELIWSKSVLEFMESKCYRNEADLVRIIRNWHRAVDDRGLSEEDRFYNIKAMLHWLLRDWIPSFVEQSIDFRLLDVARNITISKVSLELRRAKYKSRNISPEHPPMGLVMEMHLIPRNSTIHFQKY